LHPILLPPERVSHPTHALPRNSFCTTCFNRAYQLKQVFAANAAVIAADRSLEWVILNYASEDDLDDFMQAQLPTVSRRIVYARETRKRPWHVSIAKNMAHRVATGRVLMNLDGDNLIADAAELIHVAFAEGTKLLHLWSTIPRDGTFGRIAITREAFLALGGYDESFLPMTHQDQDLMKRALASGLGEPAWRYPSPPGCAVRNTNKDSIKHCRTDGLTWNQMKQANTERSKENLKASRFVANAETGWCDMNPQLCRGELNDRAATLARTQSAFGPREFKIEN